MREFIYAWTQSGPGSPHPSPFFNFTAEGDRVELILRDHPDMVQHENGAYLAAGHQATLSFPKEEVAKLATELFRWLWRHADGGKNAVVLIDADGFRAGSRLPPQSAVAIRDCGEHGRPEPSEWR